MSARVQDPFTFFGRIDGSASFYTINYFDPTSGSGCGSVTIPASSCKSVGVCSHMFELLSSSCPHSDDITVTVYATNVLGNGPTSQPITIGISYICTTHADGYISSFLSHYYRMMTYL